MRAEESRVESRLEKSAHVRAGCGAETMDPSLLLQVVVTKCHYLVATAESSDSASSQPIIWKCISFCEPTFDSQKLLSCCVLATVVVVGVVAAKQEMTTSRVSAQDRATYLGGQVAAVEAGARLRTTNEIRSLLNVVVLEFKLELELELGRSSCDFKSHILSAHPRLLYLSESGREATQTTLGALTSPMEESRTIEQLL